MPRKGWSTVQVPDGWLQLIRGPRPQSAKWPMKGQPKSNVKVRETARRDSQVGQDALKKAKAQAQVRPVADRIASSKVFIERAKKRILTGREDVSRAQEALTSAQVKLQSEEQGLADAEARLASLILEESNGPPPTVPADIAQELAELRACVQQLQRENTDLNCNSKVKVAKNGKGNIREICQVRHSIWHLHTAITVAQRSARGRVRPYFKDCPSHLSGWRH